MSLWIWALAAICVVIVARCAAACRHPLLRLLGSALGGVGTMALLGIVSPYTGVAMPLNPATAFTGIVLGVPGVILVLLLNLILL